MRTELSAMPPQKLKVPLKQGFLPFFVPWTPTEPLSEKDILMLQIQAVKMIEETNTFGV
jgi:hypothetical protein